MVNGWRGMMMIKRRRRRRRLAVMVYARCNNSCIVWLTHSTYCVVQCLYQSAWWWMVHGFPVQNRVHADEQNGIWLLLLVAMSCFVVVVVTRKLTRPLDVLLLWSRSAAATVVIVCGGWPSYPHADYAFDLAKVFIRIRNNTCCFMEWNGLTCSRSLLFDKPFGYITRSECNISSLWVSAPRAEAYMPKRDFHMNFNEKMSAIALSQSQARKTILWSISTRTKRILERILDKVEIVEWWNLFRMFTFRDSQKDFVFVLEMDLHNLLDLRVTITVNFNEGYLEQMFVLLFIYRHDLCSHSFAYLPCRPWNSRLPHIIWNNSKTIPVDRRCEPTCNCTATNKFIFKQIFNLKRLEWFAVCSVNSNTPLTEWWSPNGGSVMFVY